MNKLEKARLAINEADAQIAQLFEKRMHAVEDVVAYKMENGLPVFDGAREKEVIEKTLPKSPTKNSNPITKICLCSLCA